MKIGLIDVDGHNFPNFALMKISAFHKAKGDEVEWAKPNDLFSHQHYNILYASKIFTFSNDVNFAEYSFDELQKGGTGYDIKSKLPEEIENSTMMDYSIYPQYPFSLQFLSRGCIRKCPFCLVNQKEGHIKPYPPHDLNPNGQWIEVLDNNFFANPEWRKAGEWLKQQNQPVVFHGVDVRIMDEEQAFFLNSIKIKGQIHIAWDFPQIDLRPQIKAMLKYIKAWKITCYVLIGYNSTKEQDLFRVRTLKEFGIMPFCQAYRDYNNQRKPTMYEKDFCRWADNKIIFKSCDFMDFSPRKGFKCSEYFKQ